MKNRQRGKCKGKRRWILGRREEGREGWKKGEKAERRGMTTV